jgi:esterase
MSVSLFHRQIGSSGAPALLIMHGLLGSSDNWQSLAKRYATTHDVWLLDARNHGRSPHAMEHTYDEMAADVIAFMDAHQLQRVRLMGHSMGGKTALNLVMNHPERFERAVIADMAAREYPIHHEPIFDALRSINLAKIKERVEVEQHLFQQLNDPTIVAFLMKGLRRVKTGGFAWRANLEVLHAALGNVVGAIDLGINTIPMLSIFGKKSNYVAEADLDVFDQHFLQFESYGMEDAGHWLHAERPEEFYEVTESFLNS